MKLLWLTDLQHILTVGVDAVLVTGKGFTISIPIFMLGPYLRPFLYWFSGISVAVCILLLVIAVFSQGFRSKDEFVLSALCWLVFALTAGALTLLLHFLGMP